MLIAFSLFSPVLRLLRSRIELMVRVALVALLLKTCLG
jgi:hypothetical protein